MRTFLIATAAMACFCFIYGGILAQEQQQPGDSDAKAKVQDVATTTVARQPVVGSAEPKPKQPAKLAPFITKGIHWLIEAQNDNGGWGAGSHANQQQRDPHQVKTDPATTSFATLALIRAGSSLESGPHQSQIRSAIEYLLTAVETASDDGPRITDLQGTQPQTKLGGLVDTTMTTQCLARCLQDISESHELFARMNKALDKCIAKLEKAQKSDGSWNVAGGWAPVLQSSSGLQALETARASGKSVSPTSIAKARAFQKSSIDISGRKTVGSGLGGGDAGVELYSFSTAQRGNAVDAAECNEAIIAAKASGKLNRDAKVTVENLRKIGFEDDKAEQLKEAHDRNENQIKRLNDAQLLKGFGNNGGEEFVSFLLTSESMIIAGGDKWDQWNEKMHGLMQKIQNNDGSWSGHHCITSPVFCTAAVIQCLTVENDAALLREIAKKSDRDKVATTTADKQEDKQEDSEPVQPSSGEDAETTGEASNSASKVSGAENKKSEPTGKSNDK